MPILFMYNKNYLTLKFSCFKFDRKHFVIIFYIEIPTLLRGTYC